MRTLKALLVSCALLSSVPAMAEPAKLPHRDPLTEPRPKVEPSLVPASTATVEEKIAPRLQQNLQKGSDTMIPVIVRLRQPRLSPGLEPLTPKADKALDELVAAVEHSFVEKAAALLQNPRGVPYFPIVFGKVLPSDLSELARLPEVERIYPDETHPYTRTQGASLMRADQLRSSLGANGQGIGVAVVDSGVDDTHSELAPAVAVEGNYSGEPGDGTVDDAGHGTACAGIIAGRSGGIAPAANIWAIKVGDEQGIADSAALAALAALYGSRSQFGGLHVINMSFGGGGPFNADCDNATPYDSIFDSLSAAGIAVFVSSGNDGFGAGVSEPSCHSKVISVGAVYDANLGQAVFSNCTDSSTAADQIPCYSNSGIPLDILAPSHCARTPEPGGGYNDCFGGTSAAAPYAAGVAAQILSLRPATTPAALRTALMTTGRPRTDVNGITRNSIDALAAYQSLAGTGGGGNPCVRDADTACLASNRFEVNVDWATGSDNGQGQVMSFGGQKAENDDSAFFWFFSPTNFEMGLKILNGCGLNNNFWVFISGLTNQGWTVHIRDTQTGRTKTYSNPTGRLTLTTADTAALSCQ
jgi:subtilisin family serine protease